MKNEKSVIFINILNSFDGMVIRKNNKFISRKNNIYSGIGLQNIQYIVDQYKGVIKYYPENNIFRVSIMLYQLSDN